MKFVIFAIIAIICSPILLYADNPSWVSNGPYGARVVAMAINPSNSQQILIGTIENGIYKTTNGGDDWNRIIDDTLNTSLRDIIYHPDAPDTVYASTNRGMYRSNDGGTTWHLMIPPGNPYSEINDLEIHPVNHSIIFAANHGLDGRGYKSADGGATWSTLDMEYIALVAIKIDKRQPNIVYAASQSGSHGLSVLKSEDLGENWHYIHNDLDSSLVLLDMAVDSVDNNILYVCGFVYYRRDTLCIEKTTDGGNHWFDISPPNLQYSQVYSITISPNDHQTILAATDSNGLLKSTDGGLSWREINHGFGGRKVESVIFDTQNNIMYLGTFYDGIYRSLDGGENWEKISQNIKESNCISIAINPQDKNDLFVTTMNGIYRSRDGAANWQKLEFDTPYEDAHTFDMAFSRRDPNLIFFSYDSYWQVHQPYMYRSTDNGANWQYFGQGLSDLPFIANFDIAYNPDGSYRLYLTSRGVYYSDDLGENWNYFWNDLPPSLYYSAIEVSEVSSNIVYVGEWYTSMHRSTDAGQTWQYLDGPSTTNRVYEIMADPIDSDVVYVSCDAEGIFKSTDMGNSWQNITNNLPFYANYNSTSGLAINPQNNNNLFINSYLYGVFVSYDGGDNWEDYNEGLNTHYGWADIAFAPTDTNRVYLATSEHSVWSVDRNQTNIDDNAILPISTQILSNYPNPFNPTTTIKYSLSRSSDVSLSVFNLLGQKVATLFEGNQNAGEYNVVWNARRHAFRRLFRQANRRR